MENLYCSKCGTKNDTNGNFCTNCGNSFNGLVNNNIVETANDEPFWDNDRIIEMCVAAVGLVAYFLTWIDISVLGTAFGLKANGFELPKFFKQVTKMQEGLADFTHQTNILHWDGAPMLYGLPICLALIMVSIASDFGNAKKLFYAVYMIIMSFLFYTLIHVSMSITDFGGIGLYISFIVALFYLYEVLMSILRNI